MQIYLDNAATTPVDKRVSKVMFDWQDKTFGNPSSPHRHGQDAKIKLEEVRDFVASNLNCWPKEIVFTSGGTESNNKALIGACLAKKEKGNHILISSVEHPSVLDSMAFLEKNGFEVSYLDTDKNGSINLEEIENNIRTDTILLSAMYVNNETGVIFPVEEIGKISRDKNTIFHCDAVQAFGKINLDVAKLNVDLMSFSAHKIYGPKGVGGVFIRDGIYLEPQSFGGGQEANKRPGTENLLGIIGLGKALELMKNHKQEWQQISSLNHSFELAVSKIPGSMINAKEMKRSPYISNISFPGIDNQSLLLKLDMAGLSASVGSACSSGSIKQSHVLRAMNLPQDIVNSALRFSFGRFTTDQELDLAIEIITKVITK